MAIVLYNLNGRKEPLGVEKAYSAPDFSAKQRAIQGEQSESRVATIVNISHLLVSEIYAQNILK